MHPPLAGRLRPPANGHPLEYIEERTKQSQRADRSRSARGCLHPHAVTATAPRGRDLASPFGQTEPREPMRASRLLSGERRIRRLLDFGKHQRMRRTKAITRRPRPGRALRHDSVTLAQRLWRVLSFSTASGAGLSFGDQTRAWPRRLLAHPRLTRSTRGAAVGRRSATTRPFPSDVESGRRRGQPLTRA